MRSRPSRSTSRPPRSRCGGETSPTHGAPAIAAGSCRRDRGLDPQRPGQPRRQPRCRPPPRPRRANDATWPAWPEARERAQEVLRSAETTVRKHGVASTLGSRRLADAWLATARAHRRPGRRPRRSRGLVGRRRRLGLAAAIRTETARARWREAAAGSGPVRAGPVGPTPGRHCWRRRPSPSSSAPCRCSGAPAGWAGASSSLPPGSMTGLPVRMTGPDAYRWARSPSARRRCRWSARCRDGRDGRDGAAIVEGVARVPRPRRGAIPSASARASARCWPRSPAGGPTARSASGCSSARRPLACMSATS